MLLPNSVILNQIALWIETDADWDVYDLRNVAKTLVLNELEVVGYLKGYTYDVEIRRVLNRELNIDHVYGVDIPCLANRTPDADFLQRVAEIRDKCLGAEGVLIHRCLADLSSAMKHADDTGFYCYRAIESLRQHCILKFGLDPERKDVHWVKFRELTRCSEDILREIKAAADPVRHGEVVKITRASNYALHRTLNDGERPSDVITTIAGLRGDHD
jgi:hypothetical protein